MFNCVLCTERMRINIKVEDINATNLARIFGVSISFNNCFCDVLQLVIITRYLDFTARSADFRHRAKKVLA